MSTVLVVRKVQVKLASLSTRHVNNLFTNSIANFAISDIYNEYAAIYGKFKINSFNAHGWDVRRPYEGLLQLF